MSKLSWIDGGTYRLAAKTEDGSYVIAMSVGGSRGPVFRAEHHVGVGLGAAIADPRDTITEAKADAQAHHDELQRQAAAAAKDPTE